MDHQKAQRHLARRDEVLKRLIGLVGPCTLQHDPDGFAVLARSIIAQQISGKAAQAISGRLLKALGRGGFKPGNILKATDESFKAAGVSPGKMRALRDLAEKCQSGLVPLKKLPDLQDDEIVDCLVQVRGIGPWTAEMFLIFSLGRHDVLAHTDYGLRAGVQKQYRLETLPDKSMLTTIAEPWRPYRSIGTWFIWRSFGAVPQSE